MWICCLGKFSKCFHCPCYLRSIGPIPSCLPSSAKYRTDAMSSLMSYIINDLIEWLPALREGGGGAGGAGGRSLAIRPNHCIIQTPLLYFCTNRAGLFRLVDSRKHVLQVLTLLAILLTHLRFGICWKIYLPNCLLSECFVHDLLVCTRAWSRATNT